MLIDEILDSNDVRSYSYCKMAVETTGYLFLDCQITFTFWVKIYREVNFRHFEKKNEIR